MLKKLYELIIYGDRVDITVEQYNSIVFIRDYFSEESQNYSDPIDLAPRRADAALAMLNLPLHLHHYVFMPENELPTFKVSTKMLKYSPPNVEPNVRLPE